MCILFLLFPEHKARHKETRNRLEHTGLQMSCLCSFNDLMNNRRCSQVISMRGLVVPQAAIFTKLTSQLAQKPTFMQIPSLDISFFHVMWSLFPLEPFLMSSQQEESWQAEALLLHLHWLPERPPSAARCHLSSLALGFDSEDAVIPAFRRIKATADWSLWCLTEQIQNEPVWACSQTIVIKRKNWFSSWNFSSFSPFSSSLICSTFSCLLNTRSRWFWSFLTVSHPLEHQWLLNILYFSTKPDQADLQWWA